MNQKSEAGVISQDRLFKFQLSLSRVVRVTPTWPLTSDF